jgi:hypothetical protein
MSLPLVVRRALAVTTATALLSTGGVASGFIASAFAVNEPTVTATGISPKSAPNTGSTTVVISGGTFVGQDTVNFVPNAAYFGSPLPTDTGPITAMVDPQGQGSTPTALRVTVPLALAGPGSYDITVEQTGSSLVNCAQCFTVTSVHVPDATNVTPGAGSSRGPGALDINGSFFARGASVAFIADGQTTPDTGLSFIPGDPNTKTSTSSGGYPSSAQIRGNYKATMAATPGRHALQVTNTNGEAGASAEFWQPLASGLSPASQGAGSQNKLVTVTGQGIRAGSALAIQSLSTSGGPDVTVGQATVNPTGTSISAPVSFSPTATTGTLRSVTVNGIDGGTYMLPDAFRATSAPSISGLTPTALGGGAIHDVTISGTNFAAGGSSGLPTFTVSGPGVTAVTKSVVVNASPATTATVAVTVDPDAAPGVRTITATNPDGGSSSTFPFTVNAAPMVDPNGVAPPSAKPGHATTVTLTGSGFDAGGVTVEFSFPPSGGARTTDTSLVVTNVVVTKGNPDRLTFTLTPSSSSPPGLRDITITNNGDFGTSVCSRCFGSDVLSTDASTKSGQNTGPVTVKFLGTGIPAGSNVQLIHTGDPAYQPHLTGTSVVVAADGTSLTAVFDLTGAAPGTYNGVVSQGSTVLSCSACFGVTAVTPNLTSLAPNTGGQGAVNRVVTLKGSGFSRGSMVTIAGTNVHDVAYVSPTQLTAMVDIPSDTPVGAKNVTVTNADGVGSRTLTNGFTVTTPPTVSGSTPASYGQGAKSQTITITGPGFVTGTNGGPSSTASFGPGITVLSAVVTQGMSFPVLATDPDDTLVATVTIAESAAAGLRDVSVINPDGGVGTKINAFTVNTGPKVFSVSPTALMPGSSGKTLTFTGSGFSTTSGKTAVPTIPGVTLTSPAVSPDGTTITATAAIATSQAKGLTNPAVNNPTDQGNGTCVGCFAIATVPSAPTGVRAASGQNQVVVTWTAPTDNGGTPITSYVVSAVGPDSKPAGNVVTVDGSSRTGTINGLTTGTQYTISVIARNAVGSSAAANAASSAAGAPSAPTFVSATPGDGQVQVSFPAAADNGNAVTSYTVYVTTGTTTFTRSTTGTSLLVTGLTNGTTYSFQVSATNSAGEGPKSQAATATPTATPLSITTSNGGPLAGQQSFLTVFGTPGATYDVVAANRPSSTFVLAHQGILDGNGRSVFEVHPLNNVNFIARSGGVSSAQVIMSVHTGLNIGVKSSGQVLTFYGQIYPNNRAQAIFIKVADGSANGTIVGQATRDASGKNWTFRHDFASAAGRTLTFFSATASDTQNANGHSANLRTTVQPNQPQALPRSG